MGFCSDLLKTCARGLIFVLIGVLAVEFLGGVYLKFRYGASGKSYGIFQPDSELRMVHKPHSFNTWTRLNNYGFRNPDDVAADKKEGVLRVLAVGGSTTFGINLKDEDTYPLKLQRKLRLHPDFKTAEVWNAGVVCYSAGHNLVLLKRLLPKLKPDYVLLFEGVNEQLNAWVLQQDGFNLDNLKDYGLIGKKYSQADWLMQNSFIIKLISSRWVKFEEAKRAKKAREDEARHVPEKKLEAIHPWIIENYRRLLREMIQEIRQHGATPVIIRFATHRRPDLRLFSDLSRDIGISEKVPVLDEQSLFERQGMPARDLFIYTGVHVTPEGAEILAQSLSELILKEETKKRG